MPIARAHSAHLPAAATDEASTRLHASHAQTSRTSLEPTPANPPLTPVSRFETVASGSFEHTPKTKDRCVGFTRDGRSCAAFAHGDSWFCIFHDPAYREARRRNASAGGTRSAEVRRSRPVPIIPLDVSTPASRLDLLGYLVSALFQGRISPSQSAAISRLLSLATDHGRSTGVDPELLLRLINARFRATQAPRP